LCQESRAERDGKKKTRRGGIYHEKLGVFSDSLGT